MPIGIIYNPCQLEFLSAKVYLCGTMQSVFAPFTPEGFNSYAVINMQLPNYNNFVCEMSAFSCTPQA